jgi:hypothetical protein
MKQSIFLDRFVPRDDNYFCKYFSDSNAAIQPVPADVIA